MNKKNDETGNIMLNALDLPGDLKKLTISQCEELCSADKTDTY